MKDSKDIFDLFKDNEEKLNRPPSSRAWDRLEGRLDNHKQHNKQTTAQRAPQLIRRWLSMASVLLVLVLAISGLNLLFQRKSNATAMNQKSTSPSAQLVLEEIGLYSDQDNTRKDMALYRAQLNRLNTNPILEGDPSKELRVQQSVFINMKEENTRKLLAENMNQKPKKIAAKKKAMKDSAPNKTETIAKASKVKKEMQAAASTAVPSVRSEESNAKAVMEEIVSSPSPAAAGMAMEEASDLMEVESKSDISTNRTELSAFHWILGEWNNSSVPNIKATESTKARNTAANNGTTNLQSVENWTQTNATTFIGKGFILDQDKKIEIESMQIVQDGDVLYYSLQIKEKILRYTLKSFSEELVVFENYEVAFPSQVILQKGANGRSFSTIFKGDSTVFSDNDLLEYFKLRNELNSGEFKRVMERKD